MATSSINYCGKGKSAIGIFFNNEEFVTPVDPRRDEEYVTAKVRNAILTGDPDEINSSIRLMWLSNNLIAKALQDDIKSPSSIPFIEKAFAPHFD